MNYGGSNGGTNGGTNSNTNTSGPQIPNTSTLNPNGKSPFANRDGINTPNPYNQPYTPYSNTFVNNSVPGNTRAIEKAFDCCLEHRDLIAALRGRLTALRAKAEANKKGIEDLGVRYDATEQEVEVLETKVGNNVTAIGSLEGRNKANNDMIQALGDRVD